jgi:adenylate cyclase
MQEQNRQLAAILFTDIVGYTAMMQKDEQNALAVTRHYIATLKQAAETFHGRILNDYGDGSLCCFPSATEAVKAAVQIQQQLQLEPKVPLRIGIHVGELFFEQNKVMGDSVNVASRIQSLGQANTILFSKEVFDKLKNQPEYRSVSVGKFEFQHVDEPLEIFALANEGLVVPKREQLSGKLKKIKKRSGRKTLMIGAAFLILLSTSFLIYRSSSVSANAEDEKSIAVLPFENSVTNDQEEYISDGIPQDIINNLSKISSLQKVIGWFSVRRLKKTTQPLNEIANELGVATILSGSVQKLKDKNHLVVELTNTVTNKRLWGDEYYLDNKDLLTIQSKITNQIIIALKIKLTEQEKGTIGKHYTENVEAYKLYRRGRSFWDVRTPQSYDSAKIYYQKALELDPDYALAYSGLADCYVLPFNGLPQLEGMPIAKTYAMKALSLDSTLCEAVTTIGFIQSAFEYNWTESKRTLKKAIEFDPNYPIAHIYYGNLLQYTAENTEQGINEIKKALSLDPLSNSVNWVLGRNFCFAHQYDSAYEQLKKTLTLFPNYLQTIPTLIYVLLQRKNYKEAIELCKRLRGDWRGLILSYAYAASGDTAASKKELENTLKEYPHFSLYPSALVYTILKNYDQAIRLLNMAYDARDIDMYFINVDPALDPIRNEPGFKLLIKKMNL